MMVFRMVILRVTIPKFHAIPKCPSFISVNSHEFLQTFPLLPESPDDRKACDAKQPSAWTAGWPVDRVKKCGRCLLWWRITIFNGKITIFLMGKSQFFMGKSTISMATFHCELLVHQRVDGYQLIL